MRNLTIETVTTLDDSGWSEVARNRSLTSATFCQFELAEEVIGLLRFVDSMYEVGIGEALRPYNVRYSGPDEAEANHVFWGIVVEHASW